MRVQKISRSFLSCGLSKLCPLFVIAFCMFGGTVICQETKTVTRQTKTGIETFDYILVPDATEPCSAVECAWWKELRNAANDLQKSGTEYCKKKFVALFVEGLEKSYRIPLKDQPPQPLLYSPRPKTDGVGRTKKNGTIELSVEWRADASIGDVTVVKELDPELAKLYVQSARQILFLPAIKNHKFVDDRRAFKYSIFRAGWSN